MKKQPIPGSLRLWQLVVFLIAPVLCALVCLCIGRMNVPVRDLVSLLLGRNGKSLFGSTQDVVTEQNISDYFGVRAVIGSIETPDGAYADVIPVSAAQSEEAP